MPMFIHQTKLKLILLLSYNTIDYKINWQLANQMLLLPTRTEFLRYKTVALSGVTFLVLKLKLF